MWRQLQRLWQKVATPQALAAVLAVALVTGGYLISPQIIRPTISAGVPVIEPIEPQVRSAAILVPPVDCAKVACLALTFDDGPSPAITPQVLDTLSRHNVRSTFFLIGIHVADNPALVRRIHDEGHEIGNHTWSHRDLPELSPQELEDDIAHAQSAIIATGVPAPKLFRAPYGAIDPVVRSHVPYTIVSWNVDPEDWKTKKPEKVIEAVLANAKPGAIVDLHDIYQSTADALDPMLTALQQNYHLVTVSELLDLPSGQPGVFYSR